MKTLAGRTMWTVAVMAVLGVTTSVAHAGHYNRIDDHARDIERIADRAQRDVRLGFNGLPIGIERCLLTNLYRLEKNAECIIDLTRYPGNLDDIARRVDEMFGQLAEVEEHVNQLRSWCRSCDVPRHLRSSCGTMSRAHERALRELCERVGRIRSELTCLADELQELLAPCLDRRHGRSVTPHPTIIVPPPAPRGPVVQPSIHFGIGTSSRGSAWDRSSSRFWIDSRRDSFRHDSFRRDDCRDDGFRGSRFGHGRTSFSVPNGGRSFGFSFSIR
jgi:hypothetical protein